MVERIACNDEVAGSSPAPGSTTNSSNTMSNTKNNGGPAFPCEAREMSNMNDGAREVMITTKKSGMTLRDYFAAKAMASMLVGRTPQELLSLYSYGADGRSKVAIDAYLFADTMLKAREQ